MPILGQCWLRVGVDLKIGRAILEATLGPPEGQNSSLRPPWPKTPNPYSRSPYKTARDHRIQVTKSIALRASLLFYTRSLREPATVLKPWPPAKVDLHLPGLLRLPSQQSKLHASGFPWGEFTLTFVEYSGPDYSLISLGLGAFRWGYSSCFNKRSSLQKHITGPSYSRYP